MSGARTHKFKLKTPIVGHGGTTDTVEFQEPSYRHYMEFGLPYIIQEGTVLPVNGVIDQYLQKLIVGPPDYLVFSSQADLKTAMEVSGWLLSFFRTGEAAPEATPTSPTI